MNTLLHDWHQDGFNEVVYVNAIFFTDRLELAVNGSVNFETNVLPVEHVSALVKKATHRAIPANAATFDHMFCAAENRAYTRRGWFTAGGGGNHAGACSGWRCLSPYRSSRSISHGLGSPRSRQLLTACATRPRLLASAETPPSVCIAFSSMSIL